MILNLPNKIYISSANVDMRKSIDGLASIVESFFDCSSTDDALFVFHNRYCDKVKMLYWNTEGFCLLYKRIERGRYKMIIELEAQISALKKQLKNIAEESRKKEEKLTSRIKKQ